MSIMLITGIPGSGKTLYAVSKLKKAIEDNMALPVDEQRKIYCDITGLKIENIEPPPIDWRTTPPKSLLIYDEAQFHDEFKPQRGISKYKMVEDLTIHRKTGHEIWFITQDPGRLHNDILNMVEQHFHLERPYGAKLATIYQYRGVEKFAKRPTVKERAERKSLFNYDKSLFDLYESSQVDDGIKFRLPGKITGYILFTIACFALGGYLLFTPSTQQYIKAGQGDPNAYDKPKSPSAVASSVEAVKPQNLSVTASSVAPVLTPEQFEQTRVAMVFADDKTCVAKNSRGEVLYENDLTCLQYATGTKSMNFSRQDLTAKHSHNVSNTPIQQVSMDTVTTGVSNAGL